MENKKRKIAFNTHLILFIILIAVFSYVSIGLLSSEGDSPLLSLCGFSLVAVFVFAILISPLVFVFDDDNLTIIYVLGTKEIIPWKEIRSITKLGGWFGGKGKGMPTYKIAYPKSKKGPFYVDSSVSCSFKTKRLMKLYYGKKIKERWD